MALSLGKQTVEPLDYDRIQIDRGKLVTDESELPDLANSELFSRYKNTEDGISPRVLPGMKNGLHHVTGVEHDETGRPSEQATNRKMMMEKRIGKLENGIDFPEPVFVDAEHEEADLLMVGLMFYSWNDPRGERTAGSRGYQSEPRSCTTSSALPYRGNV